MTHIENDKDSISIITYYTQNASCKGLNQQKQIFDDFFDLICSPNFTKLSEKAQFSAITCVKGLLTNYDSVTLGVSNNDRLEAICCLAGLQPDNKNQDNLLTREALKCLANILLVAQELRSIFHMLSSAPLILERLSKVEDSYSTDALFLYSRILFFSTAEPSVFLIKTVLNHDFDKVVLKVLSKLENQPSAQGKKEYSIELYFTEILKVVFSLLVNFSKSFALQDAEPFSDGDPSNFILEKFRSLFFPLLRLVSFERKPIPDQIFVNTLPILVNFSQ
ncbi:hypothetical protein DSO57_1014637 [Entomophthora muscae]|uniref:Uncharacterized protein n=1 Tax=Entomophthora muscae TaxID=34485 RepID=A0ACC2RK55_9FUNG|nr:hypothetical protein DSO57_1014637 [Entomophthora muscae]